MQGLCTAAFRTLYEDDLVEEDAFFRWKDDLKDKSDGKQEAIMDTFQWLKWLEEAEVGCPLCPGCSRSVVPDAVRDLQHM